MGFKFNPFSGNFDQTGSGGGASYIDGEEATYNDLSLDAGVAPLNSAWLVRNSSGIWPFNKPGGIYIRTATGGSSRDADYTYAGTMPDVFSDAVLTIYDEASTTRTGQFNLGSVTAGQNRVLTWPNANGTIARTEDFAAPPAIGNTTRNTVAATTMSATGAITGAVAGTTSATSGCNGFQIPVPAAGGASAVGMYGTFSNGNQRAVIFGAGTSGSTSTLADFSASGLVANSIQNTPIGSTTRNSGAFTTLSADSGTVTASAPVIDASQTWNASGTTFTGVRFNIINTASATASVPFDFQIGGTSFFQIRRDGTGRFGSTDIGGYSVGSNNGGFTVRNAAGNSITLGTSVTIYGEGGSVTSHDFYRGSAPQSIRAYSTATGGTSGNPANYERLAIVPQTGNSFLIDTQKLGTGSARGLIIRTDGSNRLTFGEAGTITLNTTLAADAQNISTDTTTGTKIGTATNQKIGFFDKTPVVQQAAIADATDAATTQARLNDLLATMRAFGLIAT